MIRLLNNPTFDNERNILNADLFVNNLKNTLKAFDLHTKVTYIVYRNIQFLINPSFIYKVFNKLKFKIVKFNIKMFEVKPNISLP